MLKILDVRPLIHVKLMLSFTLIVVDARVYSEDDPTEDMAASPIGLAMLGSLQRRGGSNECSCSY